MKHYLILKNLKKKLLSKKSEKEAFKNSMIQFGFNYDENYHLKMYQEINTAIWKEFEEGLITQAKLKIDRFKRLSDRLEVSFDAEEFAKAYMEHLANGSFLYEGSIELLEDLHKSHKLSIVTNGLTAVQEIYINHTNFQ